MTRYEELAAALGREPTPIEVKRALRAIYESAAKDRLFRQNAGRASLSSSKDTP